MNEKDAATPEHEDAKIVLPKALQAFEEGQLDHAEEILREVIQRTPTDYQYAYEGEDGSLYIKCWDQESFLHYVLYQRKCGAPERSIYWISNAYGRAHFYLGCLYVEKRNPQEAIRWLDAGLVLEPENPYFRTERAKAFGMLQQNDQALADYEAVIAHGEAVPPTPYALALRGKGALLIEQNRLNEAEALFQASLKTEPDNQVAISELKYIDYLRNGGTPLTLNMTRSDQVTLKNCEFCKKPLHNALTVTLDGHPLTLCESCADWIERRSGKRKWWQFWRR